ncbi:hypothetical protein R3P38DRAFT_3202733 [Favolaschia claudopus]|uniref:Uncharacterized protein n=1 Tax=Favolaschia claudopus TaxID=2862362 RepID=A0AAW0AT09_9AGAR
MARDIDIAPPLPRGMILVREVDYLDGREAIFGRDRARRRAEERTRANKALAQAKKASNRLNNDELREARLRKQKEYEENPPVAGGPGDSNMG